MMLPRRYRFLNWLLRKTGRQFYEKHSTFFAVVDGKAVRKVRPLGSYRLASKAEAGLPDHASDLERFWAKHRQPGDPDSSLVKYASELPTIPETPNRKENSNV